MTSTVRTFFLVSLATQLIACTDFAPSTAAPDALGHFSVGHASFTEHDPARGDRPLLVDVWYPVDAIDAQDSPPTEYLLASPLSLPSEVAVDDLPVSDRADQTLLVFSHGYGSIRIQSFELMENLASHGFIVISPEHTGNSQASMEDPDTFDEAGVPTISLEVIYTRTPDSFSWRQVRGPTVPLVTTSARASARMLRFISTPMAR